MIHSNYASCRRAALFMGLFFCCLGAPAQDAITAAQQGMPSPLPTATVPGASYKFDASFKTGVTDKVSLSERTTVPAMTVLQPDHQGVLRLTLDEAQQAASGAGNPLVKLPPCPYTTVAVVLPDG